MIYFTAMGLVVGHPPALETSLISQPQPLKGGGIERIAFHSVEGLLWLAVTIPQPPFLPWPTVSLQDAQSHIKMWWVVLQRLG